ncbi:hypothetical protein [Prochlorococcus marinus]|uniref:hypothetical protein n=1 Tax=Prochlorococcus marinus TaxID=1219 RepID=UPI0039AFD79B
MKKKPNLIFALRDDDVSYFTSAINYQEFLDTYVKEHSLISGVITAQKGKPCMAIPQKYWNTNLNYPIKENHAILNLLSILETTGNFFPAIHGYEHSYDVFGNTWIPELQQKNAHLNLRINIEKAEELFLDLFRNPLKLFIPPSNSLSPKCASFLFSRSYTLFNYPGLKRNSRNTIKGTFYRILRAYSIKFNKRDLLKPYNENKDSICYNSVSLLGLDSQLKLQKIADYCSSNNYPFILALHNWELDHYKIGGIGTFGETLLDILNFLGENYQIVRFIPKAKSILEKI